MKFLALSVLALIGLAFVVETAEAARRIRRNNVTVVNVAPAVVGVRGCHR